MPIGGTLSVPGRWGPAFLIGGIMLGTRVLPSQVPSRTSKLAAFRILRNVSLLLVFALSSPSFAQCVGDCNGDGRVSISELVTGVNILLGRGSLDDCPAIDDGDGTVRINDLVLSVGHSLRGCPEVIAPAEARRVSDPADLIGGPMAFGRVGDFLLQNGDIRVLIRDVGREFSFVLTYGGNIIDADLRREPGEAGRDQWGAMTPMINIASTVNVQEIEVVNDGSDGQPAVIRTVGVDDLFDALDVTNAIRGNRYRFRALECPRSRHPGRNNDRIFARTG